ncbi:ABC transporter ATP-binding protein [Salipiger sp. P9]|uniref:ABC transporter ATP-binding protein n=1 Tax=Salipiger pentaromativorans TaxID=2943193 RepID=UPI00215739E4|nr:ABC transporter ATP-binding protein [Salipiger pentaromativorans]MCR8550528.1 ABC transporter ATP-binding protein [Salipiger pentaromativorans]
MKDLPHARESAASTPPAIALRDVSKVFELETGETLTAVSDLSLTIEPGEFVCVLGPSGHGKSTLLNLVAGFLEPDAGSVEAHGDPVKGPGPDRGVIFQRDTLFLWKRVRDNIEYGMKVRGVPKAERTAKADELMEAVGLTKFASSWPRQLSGGMRRRAAIAAVFANEPPVLLMDEPFVGLDYARRAVLHDVVTSLWSRENNTIFFVTHDIDEALALATRVLVVANGSVVYDVSVDLPRPRGTDTLNGPEALEIRKSILRHLDEAMAVEEERFTPAG